MVHRLLLGILGVCFLNGCAVEVWDNAKWAERSSTADILTSAYYVGSDESWDYFELVKAELLAPTRKERFRSRIGEIYTGERMAYEGYNQPRKILIFGGKYRFKHTKDRVTIYRQ